MNERRPNFLRLFPLPGSARRARPEPPDDNARLLAQLTAAQRIACIGSWELTAAGGTLEWSDETRRILGLDGAAAVASLATLLACVHPDDREALQAVQQQALQQGDPIDFKHRIVRPDGEVRHVRQQAAIRRVGRRKVLTGTLQDITEHELAEQARRAAAEAERADNDARIEALAFYDPLTTLPNRRLLLDRLSRALINSKRHHEMGALLFIDLDRFKTINDTLGHDSGDALLKQAAARILGCVRAADTVARLGGDEFVVVLERLGRAADVAASNARRVAEKILAQFMSPFALGSVQRFTTLSIGIAFFESDRLAAGELLKQADLAMYEAKSAGRNTLRFFDPSIESLATDRSRIETALRRAVQEHQFELHFQPQLDRHGKLVGAEALLRWTHDEWGAVSPSEFIPLAEETGLIVPIGRLVLETACSELAAWTRDPQMADLCLTVNVSARQFGHPDFVDEVTAALNRHGVRADRLKLELTESMLAENVERFAARMAVLRSMGVTFALDDFGIGYSSLSYLKQLPLDQIKIDQSFVRDILLDAEDASITCMIIELGHTLGLEVIAEGVETAGQLEMLAQLGCDGFQGHLFSPAVPASAFFDIAHGIGLAVPEARQKHIDGRDNL